MRHAFRILEELGAECDRLGVRVVDVHGESGPASEFLTKIVRYIEARERECDRYTLADAEREAISRVYDLLCDRSRELQSATRLDEARPLIQWAQTLQGLWERLSGSAAISGAGKSAPAANTPAALTDEEREAVSYYVGTGGPDAVDATLRGLLERNGAVDGRETVQ